MLDETEAFDLKLETLSGDIRDAMLMHFREAKRPWSLLTQDEQRGIANAMESAASHLVRQVVAMLTQYEFPRCVVTLGEVKIKGEKGLEAKITAPNIEAYRSTLGDYVGQLVCMVMVDSDDFLGERHGVDIEADQPDLPLKASDDEAEE